MKNSYFSKLSGHVGGVYPFYNIGNEHGASLLVSDVLRQRKDDGLPVEIDIAGFVTKLCLPHMLGNRTLVKGVRRAPWMSLYDDKRWNPLPLPLHGTRRPEPNEFSEELKLALMGEARSYTTGRKTVGILLSGGMDSRIVAGVLRSLQLSEDSQFEVVALTWGADESRDVQYSKIIASRFGWRRVHFPITVATLESNIDLAGALGAEVSPIHLHAMSEVSELRGIDVVVAGSYGDSIGRGEYSGVHVSKLDAMVPKAIDKFGLVKSSAIRAVMPCIEKDLVDYPSVAHADEQLRVREIEQQMHYLRRMLQSCMQVIAINIPLYQMFTSHKVVSMMWGLDASVRNNDWYSRLLERLPGELSNIPWARTGLLYGYNSGTPDNYSRRYHKYGLWMRTELRDLMYHRVLSDELNELGVLNHRALSRLLRTWERSKTESTNALDEKISWLASLQEFIRLYNVNTSSQMVSSTSSSDFFRSRLGHLRSEVYVAVRDRLRT